MVQDDDARSDSSWQLLGSRPGGTRCRCDEDMCSDASWDVLDARASLDVSHHLEDDGRSDASWDVLESRKSSIVLDVRNSDCFASASSAINVGKPPFHDSRLCSHNCPCPEHAGHGFIDLVVSAQWKCALSLLCTAAEPERLVRQRDSDDDSVLSWLVYRSNRNCGMACLELLCRLLLLCPSDLYKRSSMKFLPMHDAAWGNAPAAIAMILCAAFPSAVNDVSQGQTPHQVGQYHHSKFTTRTNFSHGAVQGKTLRVQQQILFSWPAPEDMLRDSSELSSRLDWLESLVQLFAAHRCSSVENLRSLSADTWQSECYVPQGFATVLVDYFNPQVRIDVVQLPSITRLPSIPESAKPHVSRRAPRQPRLPASAKLQRKRVELETMGVDEDDLWSSVHARHAIEYVREPSAKDVRPSAGKRRVRNTRCDFRQLMTVVDVAGVAHHLAFHTVQTLPIDCQRQNTSAKWPSKSGWRRERAWQRYRKVHAAEHVPYGQAAF